MVGVRHLIDLAPLLFLLFCYYDGTENRRKCGCEPSRLFVFLLNFMAALLHVNIFLYAAYTVCTQSFTYMITQGYPGIYVYGKILFEGTTKRVFISFSYLYVLID